MFQCLVTKRQRQMRFAYTRCTKESDVFSSTNPFELGQFLDRTGVNGRLSTEIEVFQPFNAREMSRL